MIEFKQQQIFDKWNVKPTLNSDHPSYPLIYKNSNVFRNCCYDSKNNLISDSALSRGNRKGGTFYVDQVNPFLNRNVNNYFDGKIYFVGYSNPGHWGHFLTETLSRVGYLNSDSKNVISSSDLGPIKEIYPQHEYHIFNSPFTVDVLEVPKPTMVNCFKVTPEHIETCRKIGDYYGRNEILNKKVYLSRTKISKLRGPHRGTIGEIELEKMLFDAGWTIYHPEELSIRDQIGIIEGAEILAGCIGSAFHTMMMTRKNPKKVIYLTCSAEKTNPNYALHDSIIENNSVYLECQSLIDDTYKTKKIHDPKKVFEYLEDSIKKI